MVVHNNILAGASGASGAAGSGYQIDRSLRFNSGDSSYLSRTPSSSGNETVWTFSFWIKLNKVDGQRQILTSYVDSSNDSLIKINSNGYLEIYNYRSGAYKTQYISNAQFRDPSSWYHFVISANGSTSLNAWVNGVAITFSTSTGPDGTDWLFNGTNSHQIGRYNTTANSDFQLADVHFVDGQALAASDFGEYDDNNVWQPKEFTGSYGTHVAPTYDSTYGSDITSTEVAKTIDGDLSTYGVPTGDFIGYTYSASNEPFINIKWENTKSSSITVYIQPWVGGGAANSGTFDSSGGNSVTIAAGATLNTKFNFPSGYQGYFRVYTSGDGAYLRMYDTGGTREFNSFYLDFSDNSSNAALGTDSSGLGTTLPGVDFDGAGDHLESADHADYSFGTNDFTIEFFLYPREFDNYQALVMKYAGGPSNSSWWISDNNNGDILFYLYYNGSTELGLLSSGVTMNLNQWNHVACVRDGSTARIYINGVQAGTGSIGTGTLNDSATALRIGEDSQGSYDLNGIMSNVRLINGTCLYPNGTTFTVPSAPLTNVTNTKLLCCQSSSSATAATVSPNTLTTSGDPFATSKNDAAWTVNNLTAAGAAWDQSQTWSSSGSGTAYNSSSDWDKAFNGIITTTTDNTFAASDATMTWTPSSPITVNTSVTLYVYNPTNGSSYGTRVNGSYITGTNNYNVPVTLTAATLGGQLTSIQLNNSSLVGPYLGGVEVDGVLLVNAGVADTAASNIDSLIDTPTNYTATGSGNNGGNYATFNPLRSNESGFNEAPTNGNLDTNPRGDFTGTIPVTSGKWYWEITIKTVTTAGQGYMGVLDVQHIQTAGSRTWGVSQIAAMRDNGDLYGDGKTGSGVSYAQGDVLGFALDANSGKLWIAKNNTWINSGDPAAGTGHAFSGLSYSAYTLIASDSQTGQVYSLNAGQRPFAYTPPTDFLSICATNLPEPTIEDGSTAFDVVLYSGTGSSQTVGSLNFSPDLAWMKQRSGTRAHMIHDTVRGDNNVLYPSQNYAEHSTSGVTFGSTGFTLGTDAHVNQSSNTYAAWTWDAGSSNTSISVGGLNSSVYNQSQTWSNLVTGTLETSYGNSSATAPFDGDTGSNYPDGIRPTNGNYLSMNFGTTFANATSVKIYGFASLDGVTYPGSEENLKINGTAIGASEWGAGSGQSSKTFSLSNGLTSLEWGYSSGSQSTGYLYLSGIEVDGKLLVDAINDSQTWSNSLSGLSGSSLTNPPNAFDTDESSYADSTAGFTLDLSGHTFGTGAHTIEVKSGGATSFTVNGSTSLSGSGSGAIVWSGTHTGELTSLVSSATGASLYYIKIDGKYLANPGQNFVTNFPSIASTVRARPETGFSIVSYTGNGTNGATVGHKLNSKPGLILLKSRGDTQNWMVYHSALGANKAIFLSTTDSAATSSVYFSNTEPTSSVFSLGTRAGINQSSDPMIAYCFAPVEGYSAFGKFSGNSSTDGPFLYCGFKPRFLLLKGVTQARNWIILDTERDAGNVGDSYLHPDSDGAENTYAIADILSNGFKMRYAGGLANQTGEDYIWAAFASHPFKTSRAR